MQAILDESKIAHKELMEAKSECKILQDKFAQSNIRILEEAQR